MSIRTDLWPPGATKTQRSIRTIDVAADTLAKLDLTGEWVFTNSGWGRAEHPTIRCERRTSTPTSGPALTKAKEKGLTKRPRPHDLRHTNASYRMGVTLVSTSDGIDSSTAAGRMMIGVLGSLAEYERELIRERTALKRAASRANGTRFGRPRKVDDTEHIATAKRMKADGHTGKDIAKYLGVSRATVYRYLADGAVA